MKICATISTLQHPGLPNTRIFHLLSSWRTNPDGAFAQGSTIFSVAESCIDVAVVMEDTTYQTIRRPWVQSPRLHGSTGHPMNMHKYPSLASKTLVLLHSFPGVDVGVATESAEA